MNVGEPLGELGEAKVLNREESQRNVVSSSKTGNKVYMKTSKVKGCKSHAYELSP